MSIAGLGYGVFGQGGNAVVVKIARNIVIVILVTIPVLLALEASSRGSFRMRAAQIQIGDGQDRVRSLLGRPTATAKSPDSWMAMITGGAPEWWSYGHHLFTPKFPWIAPFNISLAPDTNDVAVFFDSKGKVVRVHIPER